MKLYNTPTGHWAGTQDEAKALAKQHNTSWAQCEVPYDKAGLLAFLNQHRVGAVEVSTPASQQEVVAVETNIGQQWLADWQRKMANQEAANAADVALCDAILACPLDTALRLGELVMSRMRDFTK